MGAAVELAAVHGRCEDPAHPGVVPAQVRELLVRGTSPQGELGHGVGGDQTLNRKLLEIRLGRVIIELIMARTIFLMCLFGSRDQVRFQELTYLHINPV